MRIEDRYANPVLPETSTSTQATTAAVAPPRRDIDEEALAQQTRVTLQAVTPSRTEQIGAGLDAARDAFMGPYRVGTQTVVAPPHFRMTGGFNEGNVFGPGGPVQTTPQAFQASLNAHGRELCRICARAGVDVGPVMLGYGSPQALTKATQALIDAGKLQTLPAPATLADSIRQMQWDWGIGTDCVDYCMNAVAKATGNSMASLGLRPGVDPFGKDGTHVPEHFRKVDVLTAKRGDIVTLHDPTDVGHRVVVRDHRVVTANDSSLAATCKSWGRHADDFVAKGGPFHVYQLDSSWGADEGKSFGGYRRDTWVFDEKHGSWMSFNPHANRVEIASAGPAGEYFAGAYRVKGEP